MNTAHKSFPGFDALADLPDISRLTDKEAAQSLSTLQLDLIFRGSAFEDAVKRALERNDRKLVAFYLSQWREALPRLLAGAKARQAILDSPAACMVLGRVVELLLHPATTPAELEAAAADVQDRLAKLK